MKKDKIVIVIASVLCVALTVSLVGAVVYYSGIIEGKYAQISEQQILIAEAEATIISLEENNTILKNQIVTLSQTIENLNSSIAMLQDKVDELTDIINGAKPLRLTTVVVHVSEKTETHEFGRLPSVNHTYQQILSGFAPYDILLLPEWNGNLNWTETFEWLSSNFTGIPICLSVFEGGGENLPNPNVMLSASEIQQALAACDVRMIRIAEIISWYMKYNQTFPIDYVKGILSFCRNNNLKVLWSEWKISDDVLPTLKSSIAGYEDIVTYQYQTNNEYDEPLVGFTYATQFQHWGGSIQSWYWKTHGYGSERDMPALRFMQHAVTAINMGAEMLEFEPYWYFFDNYGEPREVMHALWSVI